MKRLPWSWLQDRLLVGEGGSLAFLITGELARMIVPKGARDELVLKVYADKATEAGFPEHERTILTGMHHAGFRVAQPLGDILEVTGLPDFADLDFLQGGTTRYGFRGNSARALPKEYIDGKALTEMTHGAECYVRRAEAKGYSCEHVKPSDFVLPDSPLEMHPFLVDAEQWEFRARQPRRSLLGRLRAAVF